MNLKDADKPLAPEEMIPIRERHAIALRMADCDDETDSSTWYALDVGRLLNTVLAKEAENAELRRELAAKDTTPHRYKTPPSATYPVELTTVDVPAEIPRYEASKAPDPCANGHDKCFSSNVIATWPPYYPWICRRCGAEGEDHGAYAARDEYECLRQRKVVPQGEEEKP